MHKEDTSKLLEAIAVLEQQGHSELAAALRDIEERRSKATNYVMGLHKIRRRNHHEYKMTDGTIVVMPDKDALLSIAERQNNMIAKDAEIADLKAQIAALTIGR